MTDLDLRDPSSMDIRDLRLRIASMSDTEIGVMIKGDARRILIEEIFRGMPAYFQADRAGSASMILRWVITGGSDDRTDCYDVIIADGDIRISSTGESEPTLTFTLAPVDFLKLITNNANPATMFVQGKLKAEGDLSAAADFESLFETPSD
ncbi:MAG TPA: SCP2 sterol-binding domain-containing protein [Actinocrinis sp.]|uniref:SCP2 sterol-binding domain-containing protein n=1 Tax=Actinocrinis sp. TaxID=1920516 RepID=UPI002DDCDAFD|nr:SCP2 sterol-binding domain-containing protein [Actinocrinis sp.]HEV2347243.1 SCP2 sterol-binding domain-containing protein [Actinocrinis sp.]